MALLNATSMPFRGLAIPLPMFLSSSSPGESHKENLLFMLLIGISYLNRNKIAITRVFCDWVLWSWRMRGRYGFHEVEGVIS